MNWSGWSITQAIVFAIVVLVVVWAFLQVFPVFVETFS